jgi:hypothetical protein
MRFTLTILALTLSLSCLSQRIAPTRLIQDDKLLHAFAGSYVAAPVAFATKKPVLWGTVAATSAGLAKELYDYRSYGKFDPVDLAFTAVSGFVTSFIISKLKK